MTALVIGFAFGLFMFGVAAVCAALERLARSQYAAIEVNREAVALMRRNVSLNEAALENSNKSLRLSERNVRLNEEANTREMVSR